MRGTVHACRVDGRPRQSPRMILIRASGRVAPGGAVYKSTSDVLLGTYVSVPLTLL